MSKPFQISIRRMLGAVALFSLGLALCRASLNHQIRSEYFAGGLCCFGAGIGALFGGPIAEAMVSTETTRRLLLWNALGLAVIAAIFVNNRTYFYNFFCGPSACDDNGLTQLAQHPIGGSVLAYVSLGDRKIIDTGMTTSRIMWAGKQTKEIARPIFIMPVADRWMLVVAYDANIGPRLDGPVYEIPTDIRDHVVDQLVSNNPAMNGKILPIMLDGTIDFRLIGWIALIVLVPAGAFCLFNLLRVAFPKIMAGQQSPNS